MVALFFCLISSGCIFLVAGTVTALGGYDISQDTIQGETDKTFSLAWKNSLETLNHYGTVSTEDQQKGIIQAKIESSSVKVSIEELTVKTVRLRVSARKLLMPNIKLAQKIYVRIIEHSK